MTDGSRILLIWGEPYSMTQTITHQLTHHPYRAEQVVLPAEQHTAGTWRPLGIPANRPRHSTPSCESSAGKLQGDPRGERDGGLHTASAADRCPRAPGSLRRRAGGGRAGRDRIRGDIHYQHVDGPPLVRADAGARRDVRSHPAGVRCPPLERPRVCRPAERHRQAIERSPWLGEIGLEYHFVEDASQYAAQRRVFEFFLAAAKEQDKIVNLHTTGAECEVLGLLSRYGIRRAIVHWYSGSLGTLHAMAEHGVCFTIGVEVLSSSHIQTIARAVPWEQLLTETDNPDGLQWLSGVLGMPLRIREVVDTLAELRNTTSEHIIRTVQENLARLMRDDPWLSETYASLFRQGTGTAGRGRSFHHRPQALDRWPPARAL